MTTLRYTFGLMLVIAASTMSHIATYLIHIGAWLMDCEDVTKGRDPEKSKKVLDNASQGLLVYVHGAGICVWIRHLERINEGKVPGYTRILRG